MKFFEECFKCFLLEEQLQAIELNPNRLNMDNLYQQLANIDIKNFDDDYVQSDEELRKDFKISGSYSWGLLDRTDNKFKGYILGYSPNNREITNNREEFEYILNSNDQRLKFFNTFDVQKTSDIIFKDLSPSTGFYVSSLAINDDARKTPSAGKMIYNFLNSPPGALYLYPNDILGENAKNNSGFTILNPAEFLIRVNYNNVRKQIIRHPV